MEFIKGRNCFEVYMMKSKKPAGDVWKDIAIALIAVILSAILSLLIVLVAEQK
jgi:hypothetical protein